MFTKTDRIRIISGSFAATYYVTLDGQPIHGPRSFSDANLWAEGLKAGLDIPAAPVSLSETKAAIRNRVLGGTEEGGFVDAVACCDWERALACADAFHGTNFTEIMRWRLQTLPRVPYDAYAAKHGHPVNQWPTRTGWETVDTSTEVS